MHAHFRSALISNLGIIIFFLQLEVNFIPEKQSCFSKDKVNLPIYLKSCFSFETATVLTLLALWWLLYKTKCTRQANVQQHVTSQRDWKCSTSVKNCHQRPMCKLIWKTRETRNSHSSLRYSYRDICNFLHRRSRYLEYSHHLGN